MPIQRPDIANKGLRIAVFIILLWGSAVVSGLLIPLRLEWLPLHVLHFFVIMQLYTGLFITAHDAMHGTVYPKSKKINNAIGAISLRLYALFSFKKTIAKHWEHHGHPASNEDPDYHPEGHPGLLRWYWSFVTQYMSIWQLLGMAVLFQLLVHVAGIPALQVALFWAVPAILSSMQLFYFGTYLPHRGEHSTFIDDHNARSNGYSVFWSFLTCYHFGYHWEHHAYPGTPWWLLPQRRKETLSSS